MSLTTEGHHHFQPSGIATAASYGDEGFDREALEGIKAASQCSAEMILSVNALLDQLAAIDIGPARLKVASIVQGKPSSAVSASGRSFYKRLGRRAGFVASNGRCVRACKY